MTAPATTSPRRLALLAPLLALGLLASACGGGADEPAASPTPTTSTPSADPSAPGDGEGEDGGDSGEGAGALPEVPGLDVERYVSLGDSFTAAPLVPETETQSGCLRSSGNYPSLVAEAVDAAELQDVSCTGADVTSMIGAQPTVNGSFNLPQFDALTPGTDLVTVGIGGNDFDVFSRLLAGCVRRADADPEGSPCRDAQQRGGGDALLADLRRTSDRVASVLRGIEDRLPEATVLLVGYPVLVPEDGTCPDRLPLAEDDYDYVREVNLALNDALRRAARATDTPFVDVGTASEGHDVCAEDPWVNGDDTDQERALAYHPTAEGQRAVAELVLETLTRLEGEGATA
ncbi:GDSL-type esterase/lipase family protein [Nocardioides perillae]|uniref:Lysophospholipase L1-like esterase n=1 Tax=Nocardioides perillae TaxID=1119534 RepID=A0A7Y9RUQ4_9ACTN|nr:lysophospholipase L1-like esterase [Nocardioides perillae]